MRRWLIALTCLATLLLAESAGAVSVFVLSDHRAPEDVAPTRDGGFVVADALAGRVVGVSPSGRVRVLAGGLTRPSNVAVALDGRVAIGDAGALAVRVVGTDGTSQTIATAAQLTALGGLAFAPDGALLISDAARVRRVAADGSITTVAGTGQPAGEPTTGATYGDGGPATSARLSQPAGLAFASDGSLLISDTGTNTVRRVDPAGMITTIAGRWYGQGDFKSCCFGGDGGPATSAFLRAPRGLAVSATTTYVADSGNGRVRAVAGDTMVTAVAGLRTPTAVRPVTGGLLIADTRAGHVLFARTGATTLLAVRAIRVRRAAARTNVTLATTRSATVRVRLLRHGRVLASRRVHTTSARPATVALTARRATVIELRATVAGRVAVLRHALSG